EIRGNLFTKDLAWRDHPQWFAKNLFETKNARRVLVDGNIFENSWQDQQDGDAIVLKSPAPGGNDCDWCVTEDITITNNIIRHAAGGIRIAGRDTFHTNAVGQTSRILVDNNLFYDINKDVWGGKGMMLTLANDPKDIHFTHNTGISSGSANAAVNFNGLPGSGLVVQDNIFSQTIRGDGAGEGTSALETYAPGYIFERNVIVGADSSSYPTDNFFPPSLDDVHFVDMAADNYRLTGTSPYRNAATDGTDVGANIDVIEQATSGV
ncbi:unnamed protein product, partial [marine sediment metagenome]